MVGKLKRRFRKVKFNYQLNNPFESFKGARYYKLKSSLGLTKVQTVSVDKLLIGQQAGLPLEQWIEKTNEFDRISVSLAESPYVEILKLLNSNGNLIGNVKELQQSKYYKMMQTCLKQTGHFMGYKTEAELPKQISYFYKMYQNFSSSKKIAGNETEGRSNVNSKIRVNKIRHSDYFELVDGHHRAAIHFMKKNKSIDVEVIDEKFTYLQWIILNSKQTFNIELYQPVDKPEVSHWPTIRNCKDRLDMMFNWIDKNNITTGSYIDLPCSYGYFVDNFKKRGFASKGYDIDLSSIKIAHQINRLEEEISQKDIIKYLETTTDKFDVVSCLSILHHFVMGRIDYPYMNIVKNLDKLTGKVLFLDTGQVHEKQYEGELTGWTDEFIIKLFVDNTSFKHGEILGKDQDNIGLQKENNNRTLFAFYR